MMACKIIIGSSCGPKSQMVTDTEFAHREDPSAESSSLPKAQSSLASAGDEISLLDVLVILAQGRRLILWAVAACAVIATGAAFLLPTEYTATVLLLPPRQDPSVASALMPSLAGSPLGSLAALAGGGGGNKTTNDMYVAMFESKDVEDAMVRRFGLMREYHQQYLSEARRSFEHHATVDDTNMDGLIRISIEDRDPKRAARMANGYVDEFRTLSQHLAASEALERRKFYQQQLGHARRQLGNAEDALRREEQSSGVIQFGSQTEALVQSAAYLRAQIAEKQVEIQTLRTFATGDNPLLIQTEQELKSLRAQEDKLTGSSEDPDSLIVPKGRVPQASLDYIRRLRDVKYYESLVDTMALQLEMAKLDEAKQGPIVQVISPATTPDRKSFPRRAVILLAGILCGFMLGTVLAFGRAVWIRMKDDPESSAKLALLRSTLRGRAFRLR